MEAAKLMPVDLEEATKKMKDYQSSINGLNKIYGGGLYNSDEIVAIYGKPQVGKTLFSLQEAMSQKKINVLYIDTEGGFTGMARKWYPVFRERFKFGGKVFVESCRTLESLHEFLGLKTAVVFKKKKDDKEDDESVSLDSYSEESGSGDKVVKKSVRDEKKALKEKGKMEFRIIEKRAYAPIDDCIAANKVEFVVLDSVSAPVRLAIPDEQQNFPARATATSVVMGKLIQLQEKYGVAVLVTNHASWNPAEQFNTLANMRGGLAVHHFAKRILYLDMREKKSLVNYRRIWVGRIEDRPKFSDIVGLRIDDLGFSEVTDKSLLAELVTKSEQEMLER